MIRKIKNNLKSLNKKGSSILDFVLELKENKKVKLVNFNSKEDKIKFENKNVKGKLKLHQEKINGHILDAFGNKLYAEDKENMTLRNQKNILRSSVVDNLSNFSIKNFFKPIEAVQISRGKPLRQIPKVQKIEFYDEYNKKTVKMNQYDEKDLEFTKSSVLPVVKFMKVDNDVMTDSEQLNDAFTMMRNNLKETLNLIKNEKDYLLKNLSRKIKFVNSKK